MSFNPRQGDPHARRPLDFNDYTTTWQDNKVVGVYCERQKEAHCGAHALAALLGRRITTQPQYLVQELHAWRTEEKIQLHPYRTAYKYYEENGWYSPPALNHWIKRRISPHVAICRFMTIVHGQRVNKDMILAQAPQGCQSIIMTFQHESGVYHYKTWIAKGQTWYESESIGYRGRVRTVSATDWARLAPSNNDDEVTSLYALVRIDNEDRGLCMRPEGARINNPTMEEVRSLEWVDGTTLEIQQDGTELPPRTRREPPVPQQNTHVQLPQTINCTPLTYQSTASFDTAPNQDLPSSLNVDSRPKKKTGRKPLHHNAGPAHKQTKLHYQQAILKHTTHAKKALVADAGEQSSPRLRRHLNKSRASRTQRDSVSGNEALGKQLKTPAEDPMPSTEAHNKPQNQYQYQYCRD